MIREAPQVPLGAPSKARPCRFPGRRPKGQEHFHLGCATHEPLTLRGLEAAGTWNVKELITLVDYGTYEMVSWYRGNPNYL